MRRASARIRGITILQGSQPAFDGLDPELLMVVLHNRHDDEEEKQRSGSRDQYRRHGVLARSRASRAFTTSCHASDSFGTVKPCMTGSAHPISPSRDSAIAAARASASSSSRRRRTRSSRRILCHSINGLNLLSLLLISSTFALSSGVMLPPCAS